MSTELSVDLSQLQEVIATVQKTQQAHTIRLADGVVAVVKPAQRGRSSPRSARLGQRLSAAPQYTLESAFGAVEDTAGPRDFDQMIRQTKEERAERLLQNR